MPGHDARYEAALAAALLILEQLQTNPHATTPELLSVVTFAVLQAIYEAERLTRRSLMPGAN